MKYVVKSAKTIEDAIKEALKELEAKENEVEVEVLEEPSKGLFGLIGAKEAKVKVSLKYNPIETANSFLGKVLDGMGIKAKNNIKIEDNTLLVDVEDISPSDMGILIGKRGNTLDAIQYLLSLAVNKNREEYLKVIIDSEGYREKREQTLINLANKMAEKAKYSKRAVKLEPMNPYERRVIHATLHEIGGVNTYSEGEEPYRRVVIVSK
ncbi:protein jag [Tissierella creatinini]|nr:protein jag [Tissierella creatinini]TJX61904.1 protein jag [Soehngenia saccharolytica]